MPRLNLNRQDDLEPVRLQYAISILKEKGVKDLRWTDKEISFAFKSEIVKFFPYSGWHTGKSIKDGRGLNNLLKQLN